MSRTTIDAWLDQIRTSDLSSAGENLPIENMNSFQMSGEEAALTTVAEIEQFLVTAAREYAMKLAASRAALWFYAWFDEQAGTLRCSATTVGDGRLPFGCQVIVLESPTRVAEALLKSEYLDGIPLSELESIPLDEIDWGGLEAEDRARTLAYVLDVFVRPLPRAIPSTCSNA